MGMYALGKNAASGLFACAYAGPNHCGIAEGTWLKNTFRAVFAMMNLDKEEEE
jgi:hypothetical protein